MVLPRELSDFRLLYFPLLLLVRRPFDRAVALALVLLQELVEFYEGLLEFEVFLTEGLGFITIYMCVCVCVCVGRGLS